MGGPNEIQIAGCPADLAARALDAAVGEVARIEAKFSRYRQDSALSRLNASAGRGWTLVDDETRDLLAYAHTCHEASGGLFDISSGVLRRAWDFSGRRTPPRVPAAAVLAQLLSLVGWERVEREAEQVRLPAGMELDFGGIGKEYAVDRVCALLGELGVAHGLVNLGGDTRVFGGQPMPDGHLGPWRVGIAHPREEGATLCTVALTDGAIATSGDYERFVEIDGRRYCHLLDPRTGMPVSHWQSVTVVAPLCLSAGAASTIAMLLQDRAPAFLRDQGLSFLAWGSREVVRDGLFA